MNKEPPRSNNNRGMGSAISNHLHQVSSNLQRLPPRQDSPKESYLNTSTSQCKRRRLERTIAERDRHHIKCTQDDIRIELLEIVDELDETAGLHSLVGTEYKTRCTLEIFVARYEKTPGGVKVRCGEDLWRDQKMGAVQTIRDKFGHISTRILMPKPFIISSEELFIKRRSRTVQGASVQHYKIGLADQYIAKIWLEAQNPNGPWPPIGLQSTLDPDGRMFHWLQGGIFSGPDIRLMCKGTLPLGTGAQERFDIVLKLGGLRIRSNYTLRLEVSCSPPTQSQSRSSSPTARAVETPFVHTALAEVNSADITVRAPCLPIFEGGNTNNEVQTPSERCLRTSREATSLAVPHTKRRLCDEVVKYVLEPGTKLDGINDNADIAWRTAWQVNVIRDRPDIRNEAEDYAIKWSLFVTPLRLSCNSFVAEALLKFVEENKTWFAEEPCRVREFGLHATSLRLRGSIDVECFAKCINLLRNGCEVPKKFPKADKEAAIHGADGAADGDLSERFLIHKHAIERDSADEGTWSEDADQLPANEGTDYQDAREDPESPRMEDFFDAEDSDDILEQPYYLHSYRQGITQRWPLIKHHPPEQFGIAAVIAAISIMQGFPEDNIDRLIALHMDYCPNENIQDLSYMYYNANDVVPNFEDVFMTELKLHRIMWEAGREKCEFWLTDVYRQESGTRKTVQEAIETGASAQAWDDLWKRIARECSR